MGAVSETVERVTHENIERILCAEDAHRQRTSRVYRSVAKLTQACGTVGFLIANALFFAAWVATNELIVEFDPYPYTFLLFGVSLEAIFLAILILISQNMDAAESERRHHLDLQLTLLSEREMTAMMRLLVEVAAKAGVPEDKTAEVRAFAHDTDPTGVLDEIVRAEHRHHLEKPGEKESGRSR